MRQYRSVVCFKQEHRHVRLRPSFRPAHHRHGPLMLHVIHPDGRLVTHLMTADFSGEQQVAIEPGCWFAAELPSHFGYALVSCAVAPGFTFDDFELGTFDRLSKLYPDHEDLLKRLCQ